MCQKKDATLQPNTKKEKKYEQITNTVCSKAA